MELWGWLVAYVVLFALLHLVLYYVYVRRSDGDSSATPSLADPDHSHSRGSPSPDRFPPAGDRDGDLEGSEGPDEDHHVTGDSVTCPHCGATNSADPTYTYCWHCVSTLRQ
ncbi:DUF7577 domain-containing protein [Natrarchaeobaculum aegyptiacum]|uniref:DUF7577 domain-containing protein n=1 Tax=Natrarchaeobaculum aegyptiacum TaxID=745377 RepID=A0A2Z2HSH0_9EURY|nr:hypothetical protein [Natrarchaeobaculum aegyptiacum]ARS90110.1 hypothetical protein B1756_10475 [Natrarchaeobaculum aegyptiacum]